MQKNQRLSDSFWANVSGSLGGGKAGLQVQYALQTEETVPAQRHFPCVQSVGNLRHALGSSATFSPLESNQPAEKISNLNDGKMYAWNYLTKLATEIF